MRVFETLACGSLLLTNDLRDHGQEELFRDGLHLATYRDGEDLLDKAAYYLRREDVRERIAAAGQAEVLARHTYRHRMEQLLATAAAGLAPRSVVAGGAPEATSGGPHPCLVVEGLQSQKAGAAIPDSPGMAAAATGDSGPDPGAQWRRMSMWVGGAAQPRSQTGLGSADPDAQGRIEQLPSAPAHQAEKTAVAGPGDATAFDPARPELLALIPATARIVLDVGCGAGRLGEALKARQPAEVVGIELHADVGACSCTRPAACTKRPVRMQTGGADLACVSVCAIVRLSPGPAPR